MKKKIASIIASLAMLLPGLNETKACTGARQIAMGDAGVAACNNPHAVYWNQAAIPLIKHPEISYTKQFGETEKARYDDVISMVCPLTSRIGIGAQFMKGSKGSLEKDTWKENQNWIKLGAGLKIKDSGKGEWGYSIGGALTQKTTEMNYPKAEKKEKTGIEYEASFLAERSNIFRKDDNLKLGILARQQFGLESENLAVRPGVAYTSKNRLGNLTSSFEFYEIDELLRKEKNIGRKYAKPRIGFEQGIGRHLALRAGYDGAADDGKGTFTAGAGLKYKNIKLDAAVTDKEFGWAEVSWGF